MNNSNFSFQIDFVNCFFSLIQKRSAKRVCVCVSVCVFERRMRIESVVYEKNLFFVEFKDFCLLRTILELIVRSLVNIKRRKRSLLREQDSESSRLHLRFVTNYRNSFYSLYSFRFQIILFYFNFLCCLSFLNSLNFILVSCLILLSRHQYDRLRWTTKKRSKYVLLRSKSDLDHKENERNDARIKIHDAARMNRLLYTQNFLHERSCWRDMILNKERRLMSKISQRVQRFWERISRHNVNNSTSSRSSKVDWWSHESYCEAMRI
jgi:hypothetical protein